mmetsp:Transcript_22047/g.33511  ORF Transcript_22047/g.33511 Transcript_22047/m.33511 type:complete len:312 (+) Transcript_22047:69-1004(+)|eukprot:CAMPEP_0194088764 /NCGR_PEP_ID=MMETSP0149-20130528/30904_1 /TAXON_ID=122233 /ORGANISM="Chaetoceros debilis, Strain MM31A-1" /LENGTH=311 /DNA_ID=CAMNT_0038772499 /DNA_START=9 /DNA_END=944 /DNA_ORIENTATION=-
MAHRLPVRCIATKFSVRSVRSVCATVGNGRFYSSTATSMNTSSSGTNRQGVLHNNAIKGQLQWQTKKGEPFAKAGEIFPGALTNSELIQKICQTLVHDVGLDKEKILAVTSLCCDEVNRPLEFDLANSFTSTFNMGGLAGFPFGGTTSFNAMAAHIPDGGSCLVVYGPHVGVDSTGAVGTVERRGRKSGGPCCGSATAALSSVLSGEASKSPIPDGPLDAQQNFVGQLLLPYADRLKKSNDKNVELPNSLYHAQTKLMEQIVGVSAGSVADGSIALLGGIQINTPPGHIDYFLPLGFDLYSNKAELVEKLW